VLIEGTVLFTEDYIAYLHLYYWMNCLYHFWAKKDFVETLSYHRAKISLGYHTKARSTNSNIPHSWSHAYLVVAMLILQSLWGHSLFKIRPFQHSIAHFGTCLESKIEWWGLISQSDGKRKVPHKDSEVANGVKRPFMKMFPAISQTKVREDFASFATGLDSFSDISSLDERRTMNLVIWWIYHGANDIHSQNLATHILWHLSNSLLA